MCKQFCQPHWTLIAFMQTITTFKWSMFCELGGDFDVSGALLWYMPKKLTHTDKSYITYLLSVYSATLHWWLPQALKIITVISKISWWVINFSLSVPPLSQGHLPLPMVAAQRGVVYLQNHIPSTSNVLSRLLYYYTYHTWRAPCLHLSHFCHWIIT